MINHTVEGRIQDPMEKGFCMIWFVQNVERAIKFLLSQVQANLYFVGAVLVKAAIVVVEEVATQNLEVVVILMVMIQNRVVVVILVVMIQNRMVVEIFLEPMIAQTNERDQSKA